jgi:hypothetical protein
LISGRTFDALVEAVVTGTVSALIIDQRLDGSDLDGGQIVSRVRALGLRLPTVFLSADPINVDEGNFGAARSFVKGANSQAELLEYLTKRIVLGVASILGTGGELQDSLDAIYETKAEKRLDHWWDSIAAEKARRTSEYSRWQAKMPRDSSGEHFAMPQYDEEPADFAARSMKRYVVNSLLSATIDHKDDRRLSLEYFVHLNMTVPLGTGDIVRDSNTNAIYLVISPPCDLVLRSGAKPKVMKVLLASVTDFDDWMKSESLEKDRKGALGSVRAGKFERAHHIPSSPDTGGAHWVIDFTHILSVKIGDFVNAQKWSRVEGFRIAESFMRDVTFRLSSYVGRQGQPDIG